MHHFSHDEGGALCAESVALAKIAEQVGTPTYVYSEATLARHFSVFDAAFRGTPHLICYSVKANSSRAVLELFAQMGSGADIVSGGELARVLAAGIPAERVVFSGVGKTTEEMSAALAAGILAFNVESEGELVALGEVARAMGKRAPVSLRVNPDIDAQTHPYIATGLAASKFGIPIEEAPRLAQMVAKTPSLELVGIDCHIGSQLTSLAPLLEALDSVLQLVDQLRQAGHHEIDHVDLGGGLGITYRGEKPPHPDDLGDAVAAKMAGRKERLILEPGRVIVGNAGLLLARVLYVKETKNKTFVVLDAAMNDLLRPALYGAHHEIWPVQKRVPEDIMTADVVGPVCETGDRFAEARVMPKVLPGDLVAIMSAGAYGFTMASSYNSRPLAAEVMVSGERFSVVRRRQKIEDLMRDELVPAWFGSASSEGERR